MRLSARNQLTGTVSGIDIGSVMAVVIVDLDGGQQITASITKQPASSGSGACIRSLQPRMTRTPGSKAAEGVRTKRLPARPAPGQSGSATKPVDG